MASMSFVNFVLIVVKPVLMFSGGVAHHLFHHFSDGVLDSLPFFVQILMVNRSGGEMLVGKSLISCADLWL